MVSAEASRKALLRTLVSVVFAIGILLLATSAAVFAAGNSAIRNPTLDQINANPNLHRVWSPIPWNIGIFLVLLGVFGAAAMYETMDPLARILLWIVALIAVLLIPTGGVTLFRLGFSMALSRPARSPRSLETQGPGRTSWPSASSS